MIQIQIQIQVLPFMIFFMMLFLVAARFGGTLLNEPIGCGFLTGGS